MHTRHLLSAAAALALAFSLTRAGAVVPEDTIRPNDFIIGPHLADGRARVFSGVDGTFKGTLFGSEAPGSFAPHLIYGPDGFLYAGDGHRYDGLTGALDPNYELNIPAVAGQVWGPDGHRYIATSHSLVRDDYLTTGTILLGVSNSYGDGIRNPFDAPYVGGDVIAGADGKIYAAWSTASGFGQDNSYSELWRYDPATGASEQLWWSAAPITGLAFGPDGKIYVASHWGGVWRFDPSDGSAETVIPIDADGLYVVHDVAFHPADNSLYVVGWFPYPGPGGAIARWDFIDQTFDTFRPVGALPLDFGTGGENVSLLFARGTTQPGAGVTVSPTTGTQLSFDNVEQPGITSVTPLNSDEAALPANFQVQGATTKHTTYFDITTTAAFTGTVRITVSYPEGMTAPSLLHLGELYTDANQNHQYDPGESYVDADGNGAFDPDAWVLLPNQTVDPVNRTISADTTVFSPFAIAELLHHTWSGVLQPVNSDGSSIFKLGRTVPVKFQLTGASGALTDLQARLYLAKVSNGLTGTYEEAGTTSAASSGNLFRFDPATRQYVFNLGTTGLSQGTWRLRIDLGDGAVNVVDISLRR